MRILMLFVPIFHYLSFSSLFVETALSISTEFNLLSMEFPDFSPAGLYLELHFFVCLYEIVAQNAMRTCGKEKVIWSA